MKQKESQKYKTILQVLEQELSQALGLAEQSSQAVELDQSRIGRVSRGDALLQQAMASAGKERDQLRLVAIRKALLRIEKNNFGECLECAEAISKQRLAINPEAVYCIECQQLFE